MLRHPPAGLLDVLDRDVLEEPSQRVEPHAAVAIEVREPDAAGRGERPSRGGDGYPGIEHAGDLPARGRRAVRGRPVELHASRGRDLSQVLVDDVLRVCGRGRSSGRRSSRSSSRRCGSSAPARTSPTATRAGLPRDEMDDPQADLPIPRRVHSTSETQRRRAAASRVARGTCATTPGGLASKRRSTPAVLLYRASHFTVHAEVAQVDESPLARAQRVWPRLRHPSTFACRPAHW